MVKKSKEYPEIDTKILSQFSFGDPDAKSDDVLFHCFQKIHGVEEFLGGSKNIVLGERGAGKSALFKMVTDGKLQFNFDRKDKPKHQVIVPIEDDLEYLAIANVVENRFIDRTKRSHGKYRYLWELYILSKAIEKMEEVVGTDKEIQTLRQDLGDVLGLPSTRGFQMKDLFTSYKFTMGGKIDHTGSVTPTMSIEPAKDSNTAKVEVTDYEISQIRNRLRKFIKSKNSVVIVLVDKIDDFVVGLNYEEQLKNIQALVECTQDYRFPEIKLKIFLRADLYNKLNFERGGYDKIAPQVVRLEWTLDDICEFVARRLYYNYKQLDLKIPDPGINVNLLDLDTSLKEQIKDIIRERPNNFSGAFVLIAKTLLIASKVKWSRYRKKSHSARKTDFLWEVWLKLVTYIFPRRVGHYNTNCKWEEIPIEQFFNSHFKLGGNNPNPRLILLFLQSVFEAANSYYSKNPDQRLIPANDMGEYELILKEHVLTGYKQLQITARTTVSQMNVQWRQKVELLFAIFNTPRKCQGVSIDVIREGIDWDSSPENLRRFITFFTHVGLFVPDNPSVAFEKRTYSLPIVMKTCHGC
ncbi:MAG: hypothetical protein ABL858_06185 [Candidatus Nitrotoga sp.]